MDIIGALEKSQMEIASKNGTLPFLINPKSYAVGDEFSRGEVTALIGEFNADATTAYAAWRDQKLEAYRRTKTVPRPGELERLFASSSEYLKLKADYAIQNKQIMNRTPVARTFTGGGVVNVGQNEQMEKTPDIPSRKTSKAPPATKNSGSARTSLEQLRKEAGG